MEDDNFRITLILTTTRWKRQAGWPLPTRMSSWPRSLESSSGFAIILWQNLSFLNEDVFCNLFDFYCAGWWSSSLEEAVARRCRVSALESDLQHPNWEIPFWIPTNFFLLQNTQKWGWMWTRWTSASPTRFSIIATNYYFWFICLKVDSIIIFITTSCSSTACSVTPPVERNSAPSTPGTRNLSVRWLSFNHYHLSIFVIFCKYAFSTFMI